MRKSRFILLIILLLGISQTRAHAEIIGDEGLIVGELSKSSNTRKRKTVQARQLPKYEALPALDDTSEGAVALEIHKSSKEIDLNTTSNIRLLVRSKDINFTKNKYSSFRITTYEVDDFGNRSFLSTQNVTVNNKKRSKNNIRSIEQI